MYLYVSNFPETKNSFLKIIEKPIPSHIEGIGPVIFKAGMAQVCQNCLRVSGCRPQNCLWRRPKYRQ